MTKSKRKGQSLSFEDRRLLAQVVWKRDQGLKELTAALGSRPLSNDEREALRGVLLAEMCEFGLNSQDEPNQLGLKLDAMIGVLEYY